MVSLVSNNDRRFRSPEEMVLRDQNGNLGPSIAGYIQKTKDTRAVNSKVDPELQKCKVFSEKTVEFPGFPELTTLGDVTHFFSGGGVGFRCKKGMKPESPNQDAFCLICQPEIFTLYGIFDGHGPEGHYISHICKEILVCHFLNSKARETDVEKAFRDAFIAAQAQLELQKQFNAHTSGTSVSLAYHDHRRGIVTIAHVGDCRCMLALQTQVGTYDIIEELTTPHHPSVDMEKRRIESRGGRVVHDGWCKHQIYSQKGQWPGITKSRTMGDIVAHKEAGLSSDPDIKSFRLADYAAKHEKVTLFMATYGVWEFVSSKDAAHIFGVSAGSVDNGVTNLCKESYDRWMKDSEGHNSSDITAIVIDMHLRTNADPLGGSGGMF
eukprot:TRINITY_DN1862_c0_g2_i3.p1 TRINITY_DN1862_c0_g2~~TRINITY_DN1862_c0_g2_i3.p1  ORF type:complete len:380 (+),score=76.26 TRINITY_DN1862_c0_g2_i3:97-1236(+)